MAKILSAMSGGVDSSAATALLLEQGHDVVGAYMKNWINEDEIVGHCPWQQDIDDARAVADKLGIEFRIVNLMRDYKERVVSYLLDGYRNGITPNPDVMCNREMKFGVFLDYALEEGFEAVATGHYARTRTRPDGTTDLLCGLDPNKDQTYFLALMRQHQAARALFPIGELLKPEVREVARRNNLPNAEKKDSQGICFIGEVKMTDFLRNYVEDIPGNIVNQEGKVLGRHRGLHLYTLGQRRGLGVASNTFKEAYVVVEKRSATRELVVAFDRPDTPGLYASDCRVSNVSVVNRPLTEASTTQSRPRYRTPSTPIDITPIDDTTFDVHFHEPQRALTPGQICAFYDGEILLGGGVFEHIETAPD
ncbi:MAG: tRNA 2-thiouridine(34) synthase MnmA [Verrucomicrobiae bacterium]|nr:tRNA 2-thiouridine(34) synthase MnmA [Verrucomicrobiae bacterium]